MFHDDRWQVMMMQHLKGRFINSVSIYESPAQCWVSDTYLVSTCFLWCIVNNIFDSLQDVFIEDLMFNNCRRQPQTKRINMKLTCRQRGRWCRMCRPCRPPGWPRGLWRPRPAPCGPLHWPSFSLCGWGQSPRSDGLRWMSRWAAKRKETEWTFNLQSAFCFSPAESRNDL